ncbi:response regulator [Pseudomonas sp. NPDC086251]|uniref:response regulator n=1 Tax=Pseudomonas sp. NPDC086251 TaxID=3364431 RepID=UPI003832955D
MAHTVLIVEDNEIFRSMMAEAISLLGVNISDCATADEAVSILENTSSVALVITDICMPGSMDGLELAKLIWLRWPRLPVIITSGTRIVPDELLPSHALFLSKPWSLKRLHQAIKAFLPSNAPE